MSAKLKDLVWFSRFIKTGEAYETERGEKDKDLEKGAAYLPKYIKRVGPKRRKRVRRP